MSEGEAKKTFSHVACEGYDDAVPAASVFAMAALGGHGIDVAAVTIVFSGLVDDDILRNMSSPRGK